MPINPIVSNPEKINSIQVLEEFVKKIDAYKKEYMPNASDVGVLMIQWRQFGSIYKIKSKEEAEKEMNKPIIAGETFEWGIEFYPRSYFENKKKELEKIQ